MIKPLLFAACLTGAVFTGPAFAQPMPEPTAAPVLVTDPDAPVGKAAGTFMVRGRAIGVIPLTSSSSISVIGGSVGATAQAAPELDLSYFFTDNIALELIAATTRHNVYANGTALGMVDVGSVWVLPPTLTLQYHFMPKERFSPYVGAGVNGTIFYGASPAGPTVTSLSFSNNVGAAVQIGFDYNVTGHWFANFDVKQIFLNTTASINGGAIKASTALNPTVIGAGIGYRF
jgi:outer membrane protein